MMIKIKDLFPFLSPGWVAMNYSGDWYWFADKPKIIDGIWRSDYISQHLNYRAFDIEPVKDWKKSLRKVG